MKYLVKTEAILSLLFIVLIIFSFDTVPVAIMTILSALIHELGHLTPLLLSKGEIPSLPSGKLNGLRIRIKKQLSYKEELVVLICGPLFNLLFSAVFFILHFKFGKYFYLFYFINIMTMVSNLLPIRQYDGYKIISCIISIKSKEPYYGLGVLDMISFAFCAIFSVLSLYFILKLGSGYWIFALLMCELIKSIHKYCSEF